MRLTDELTVRMAELIQERDEAVKKAKMVDELKAMYLEEHEARRGLMVGLGKIKEFMEHRDDVGSTNHERDLDSVYSAITALEKEFACWKN